MAGNINMTREQRAALLDRIDVLNKVKALMLLPGICMVTMKQAAAYFEVSLECVQKCFTRNRAELIANGAITLTPMQLREQLNGQDWLLWREQAHDSDWRFRSQPYSKRRARLVRTYWVLKALQRHN